MLSTPQAGVPATVGFVELLTFVILKLVGAVPGRLLAAEAEEIAGLDIVLHGNAVTVSLERPR